MSREEAIQNIRLGLLPLAGPSEELTINGVDIQGKCSPKLLEAYVQPLFNATNVDQLITAINTVQTNLYALGIFKDVAVSISPDKVVSIALPANNKFVARVGTNVGQSEGSGYIRGTMCNAAGLGEIVTIDTSTGTRTKSSHLLNASIPLPSVSLVGWKAETLAYSSEKLIDWSSSKAYIKGLTARVSKGNDASFGVDAVLRTLVSSSAAPNEFIQNDIGNNFKFSGFYNWRYDTRVPNEDFTGNGQGYMADIRNEIALTPSTTPFFKTLGNFQSAFKLISPFTAAFNAKLGLIVPLAPASSTHVLDRFNLGGPLDVRGFRLNHLGPHQGQNALGGDYVAAAGLSLFSPVPKVRNPNVKLHNFWNAGVLGMFDASHRLAVPSVSSGIGILYTHPSARIELNLTFPLVAHAGELVHKGLQFGVGIDFL